MSLDLMIGGESFNYTYNVSDMWYAAFPNDAGMVDIDYMPGKEAAKKLRTGLGYLLDNRDEMIKLEPENGWGSYEGFCKFLFVLILASQDYPELQWRSCR
jgi:hypothetical protein